MIIERLQKKGLIHPPAWMADNTMYLTVMGSYAYGCQQEGSSDHDLYGFAIPPKSIVFPHLAGVVQGFGNQGEKFEQWQQHHVMDVEADKEYDLQVFNIVKFFQLLMENNPNIIDSIYTAQDCVQHCTQVGHMVRENRDIFLHKGCWPKFKGYALSQLHKCKNRGSNDKQVQKMRDFEDRKGIPHNITFEEVKKEMEKRGLSTI